MLCCRIRSSLPGTHDAEATPQLWGRWGSYGHPALRCRAVSQNTLITAPLHLCLSLTSAPSGPHMLAALTSSVSVSVSLPLSYTRKNVHSQQRPHRRRGAQPEAPDAPHIRSSPGGPGNFAKCSAMWSSSRTSSVGGEERQKDCMRMPQLAQSSSLSALYINGERDSDTLPPQSPGCTA
jgi:hypothetical protein